MVIGGKGMNEAHKNVVPALVHLENQQNLEHASFSIAQTLGTSEATQPSGWKMRIELN